MYKVSVQIYKNILQRFILLEIYNKSFYWPGVGEYSIAGQQVTIVSTIFHARKCTQRQQVLIFGIQLQILNQSYIRVFRWKYKNYKGNHTDQYWVVIHQRFADFDDWSTR